jgi:hypothetical protein
MEIVTADGMEVYDTPMGGSTLHLLVRNQLASSSSLLTTNIQASPCQHPTTSPGDVLLLRKNTPIFHRLQRKPNCNGG